MIESLIAGWEDWFTFLINARAAELAGLRHTYDVVIRTHRWAPHVERDWPGLMQRYQRTRMSFTQIERRARRRAARLRQETRGLQVFARTSVHLPPTIRRSPPQNPSF